MEIKTKYEIGQHIWYTYEYRGEVHVFDDIIREINITSDGIEYWGDEAGDSIKENEIVRYEDATGLSNRIKELLEKLKEKEGVKDE